MKYCSNKEIDYLFLQLIRSGWKFYNRQAWTAYPSGRLADVDRGEISSDCRSLKNFRRDLRQAIRNV